MASLNYLWVQRARFRFASYSYLKAWGKRLQCLPEQLRKNLRRRNLTKKGASINENAEIGSITVTGKEKYLSVGAFSFLGRAKLSLFEEISIGSKVSINDGVEILTGSHDVDDPHWKLLTRRVQIDDYAWIATGAIILPGVHIGRGAVIGAGAVVSKSVAPGAIVVGNPAKPISKTRTIDLNYNPCEFLAANQAWLRG